MANNLVRMAQLARAAGAHPLLLGMKIPPNYGPVYQRRFERAFARVAEDEKLPFVEFFLAGIGGDPDFIQADGIHPNAAAQPHLLRNAWGAMAPVLAAVADCEIDPRLAVAAGPVLAADRLGAFPFHAVAAGGQPQSGDAARIVYRLNANRFHGVESLQLLIERILCFHGCACAGRDYRQWIAGWAGGLSLLAAAQLDAGFRELPMDFIGDKKTGRWLPIARRILARKALVL
jgi:hypothetical protein